ncbi:MAG TPA: tetratricopeptide repeat protein, partial [Kofleriaceae bacterium]|nr:tetratricopeptide repeat protein [Kofleriaceae bacterium]
AAAAAAPPKPAPKAAPPKPAPPKGAARPEPARPTAKPEPKTPAGFATKKPEKPRFDPATAMPVDPYAADTKRIDPSAAYRTGLQQFARGDSNGALTTFRASLAANPGYAPTWRGIGLVYEKLGKKAQARTAFQKYLQLAPNAGDAAMIRERMGRLL